MPLEALYNFFWNKVAVLEKYKALLAKALQEAREAAQEEQYKRNFDMHERV